MFLCCQGRERFGTLVVRITGLQNRQTDRQSLEGITEGDWTDVGKDVETRQRRKIDLIRKSLTSEPPAEFFISFNQLVNL